MGFHQLQNNYLLINPFIFSVADTFFTGIGGPVEITPINIKI